MIPQPTIVGGCVGIFFIITYVILSVLLKKSPNYRYAVKIIMASVGLIISVDFGLIALLNTSEYLGNLQEHRVPMIIGALAIIWEACTVFCEIYSPLITSVVTQIKDKKRSAPSIQG